MAKKKKEKTEAAGGAEHTTIASASELNDFLLNVRDKLADGTAAPVYAFSALNYVMNLPEIYTLLSKENKEVARDIWLRLKQAGLQLKTPPLLFGPEEEEVATINS